MALQAIKFADGRVLFHRIPMIIFPAYSIAHLTMLLDRMPKGQSILYEMGLQQGFKCANQSHQYWGYKKKILETLMQQSDMVGTGRVEIVRQDFAGGHFVFKFVVSPIAEDIVRYYGLQKRAMDHYERGILAGFVKAVAGDTREYVAIETRCVARGDQYCEVVVRESSAWDRKDPLVKAQWPEPVATPEELGEKATKTFLMVR